MFKNYLISYSLAPKLLNEEIINSIKKIHNAHAYVQNSTARLANN